ncbi:MAG: hypothetical protein ABR520_11955 [Mycobacteriales bacterium]|nr:hypothetical protein [Frankia sp.]
MTVTDYGDIVSALRALPGVADADVEPDPDGSGMGLLRLGLAPGYDEVQVASSVGRLLRERFGLGVDAERVQLVEDAEVRDEPAAPADAASGEPAALRPAIQRMHLVSSGLDITASVALSAGGRTETGESRGTATQSGVQRAVGLATLRALEMLVGNQVRFDLDHLDVTPTGSERTVVAGVTMTGDSGTDQLTGAAQVREDVRQAVIRAVLDAVNRRIERLL